LLLSRCAGRTKQPTTYPAGHTNAVDQPHD
jgi:hypothetical protein